MECLTSHNRTSLSHLCYSASNTTSWKHILGGGRWWLKWLGSCQRSICSSRCFTLSCQILTVEGTVRINLNIQTIECLCLMHDISCPLGRNFPSQHLLNYVINFPARMCWLTWKSLVYRVFQCPMHWFLLQHLEKHVSPQSWILEQKDWQCILYMLKLQLVWTQLNLQSIQHHRVKWKYLPCIIL